ncbi:MAG TPA: S53 family peptidase [Candidatus Acidoferrales bacterium]|nr:S53 family peptidase [Candidatus Acidoferrales bacterium]
MSPQKDRISLRGSERTLPEEARLLGPADPNERIRVTVFLRRRSAPGAFPSVEFAGAQPARERKHLSRAEFAAAHGADPDDLAKIRDFAAVHNLAVAEERPGRRSVVLTGTVAAFSEAFQVELKRYDHPKGAFRGRVGALQIPAELASVIEGVFGLDNRPQAEPHFRRRAESTGPIEPHAAGEAQTFTTPQLATLYQFPTGADGAGQCIAILELGGGYQDSDLNAYFSQLGLQKPEVLAVGVDDAGNQPGSGADTEVALDIEVAGAVAPGAKIAVYFAPNTDQGFLDALTTAVHDTANNPSVVSISWGSAESKWSQQAMAAFSSACQDAATVGVTITVASGDNGSSDGVDDGQPHVDFPASSPYVLGCGGTELFASGNQIAEEDVWNDQPGGGATGGGVSVVFQLPSWQQSANVPPAPNGQPGRGVPDVAGDAAPETGYQIVVNGQTGAVGGTSAVAPLWAGLLAQLNQLAGKPIGFLNPLLYGQLPTDVLNDITNGNNGGYSAGTNWDPCTGLGSPNGPQLVAAVQSQPQPQARAATAKPPGAPSNP